MYMYTRGDTYAYECVCTCCCGVAGLQPMSIQQLQTLQLCIAHGLFPGLFELCLHKSKNYFKTKHRQSHKVCLCEAFLVSYIGTLCCPTCMHMYNRHMYIYMCAAVISCVYMCIYIHVHVHSHRKIYKTCAASVCVRLS